MAGNNGKAATEFSIERYWVDLTAQTVRHETTACEDLEDVFGGISRGFKLLQGRSVEDAYDPAATLILNLGILSGTEFMTGLRTYFHAYSPLKRAKNGNPSAMWSAGSGKFGTKLRHLRVEEIVFTGRCDQKTMLRIHRSNSTDPTANVPAEFEFIDARFLSGSLVNKRMQTLHNIYPEAHFAVIGPAGEHYKQVRYAAIALSTENQLKSGDQKSRFCGRGGMGGVMGSKNLLAIIADTPDAPAEKSPPVMKTINQEVARGDGSRRFRDKSKNNGAGGTWANYEALNPVHAMPEMNFNPTGRELSLPLHRENVEQDAYVVKDEACYRCGIRCHKNVYDKNPQGKPGEFRAKLDFEPLNLLSSNLGIFDVDDAVDLVDLVDELCMDSISCGVSLAYAMEYNRRHPDAPIADGLAYGDFDKTLERIAKIGTGQCETIGQGALRMAEKTGDLHYAMQCKGVEFPAYLPQTNPGYPWALAGGHMSMRTYLLLLNERETGMDYWVDAITNRGLSILRDDFLGICKFSGMSNERMAEAILAITGLAVTPAEIEKTILRTFLRGYQLEQEVGFTEADYNMPADVHQEYPQVELPYFNTPEFFGRLRTQVNERFQSLMKTEGLV